MYDAIPDELKNLDQWICWRSERRDGKPTKEPISPMSKGRIDDNGERIFRKASTTDPSTWSSFEKAVAAAERHGHDGIGFVFTKSDPYIGIDIDGDLDDFGQNMADVIERFGSYAEWSPSGRGVHIICKGKLPVSNSGRRKGDVEVYQHSRFFTMTGKTYER